MRVDAIRIIRLLGHENAVYNGANLLQCDAALSIRFCSSGRHFGV